MATPQSSRGSGITAKILGVILVLFGLTLAGGGLYLATLGGSWYYLIAGALMAISGAQLVRGKVVGAWLFGLVLVGTFFWTAWESGLEYWRWVPRLGVVLLFAVLVALVTPSMKNGPSRKVGFSVAGVLFIALAVAGGLMFMPGINFDHPAKVPEAQGEDAYVADVGDELTADDPAPGEWPAYGRGSAGTRFSPLDQINADNVGQLQKVWQYRSGDMLKTGWGTENTPLQVDGSLYLCTAHSILISLDAKTGEEQWRYDPQVPDSAIPSHAACRGVTYYEVPQARLDSLSQNADENGADVATTDATANARSAGNASDEAPTAPATVAASGDVACRQRVIMGTLDAQLVEVDANTGELCESFGEDGHVRFDTNLGDTPAGYVSSHAAPVVVNNVVITGTHILDNQSIDEPSGVIRGFDVVTGEPLWAWDAGNPNQSEPLKGDAIYHRSSPNMWAQAIGDSKLNLVYLPMGNSPPDYMSRGRNPGERAYSSSLVALDADTGLPVWHFQTVHNDVWDYDLAAQPSLVDFPTDAGKVPAIILPTKQGDIYVLNRKTGEPIGNSVEERPVPQGGVEPEERTQTQPFSTFANLRFPDLTEKSMWGISPLDQLYCRIQFQQASYKGMYTPPTTDQPYIQYPSFNGGTDWGALSVDPQRGVIVANYNNFAMYNQLIPRDTANAMGLKTRAEHNESGNAVTVEGMAEPMVGASYAVLHNTAWRVPLTGMPCTEPPYGGIKAIDMKTGDTLWERPLGTARKNGPFGIESHLPINIGTPNNGGPVTTAGGLAFIAAATDDLIRAIDIETGETVWQAPLPAGGQATPMVYAVDGREYLLIRPTGHNLMKTDVGDYAIAYALPERESQ